MSLIPKKPINGKSSNLIHGLKGLAEILGCTIPTAHRYKASGDIPYYQIGRNKKVYFDKDEVLEAIQVKKGGELC